MKPQIQLMSTLQKVNGKHIKDLTVVELNEVAKELGVKITLPSIMRRQIQEKMIDNELKAFIKRKKK